MKKNLVSFLTIIIIVTYATFVEWAWGWAVILSGLKAIGIWTIGGAIALLVATHIVRAHRIHDYFATETSGQFFRLFRLTQVHNLLNTMLPFRLGETSFPLLMRKEFGISLARATAALLVMRLLDLHALLASAGVGLVMRSGHVPWAWAVWAAFLALPLALFALRGTVRMIADATLPKRLSGIVDQVAEGVPASAELFLKVWALTLINWGMKVFVMAGVLGLLGISPFAATFGGALGGELSSVLPVHAPGGVGTYPASIVAGALAFGAVTSAGGMDILAQAAINAHLLIIVSALTGTALSLFTAALWGNETHPTP